MHVIQNLFIINLSSYSELILLLCLLLLCFSFSFFQNLENFWCHPWAVVVERKQIKSSTRRTFAQTKMTLLVTLLVTLWVRCLSCKLAWSICHMSYKVMCLCWKSMLHWSSLSLQPQMARAGHKACRRDALQPCSLRNPQSDDSDVLAKGCSQISHSTNVQRLTIYTLCIPSKSKRQGVLWQVFFELKQACMVSWRSELVDIFDMNTMNVQTRQARDTQLSQFLQCCLRLCGPPVAAVLSPAKWDPLRSASVLVCADNRRVRIFLECTSTTVS